MRQRLTWLASYPKSGSTWLRLLVGAYLTGRCDINDLPREISQSDLRLDDYQAVAARPLAAMDPQSVFALRDEVLERLRNKRWALTKTHNARIQIGKKELIPEGVTDRAIYLVRDPRDIAPSYATHNGLSLDDCIKLMSSPDGVVLYPSNLVHVTSSWSQHVRSWQQAPFPVLTVRFEDLCDQPAEQLDRVLRFVGLDVDQERIGCAVELTNLDRLRDMEDREGFGESQRPFFGRTHERLTEAQRAQIEHDHADVMHAMDYGATRQASGKAKTEMEAA